MGVIVFLSSMYLLSVGCCVATLVYMEIDNELLMGDLIELKDYMHDTAKKS